MNNESIALAAMQAAAEDGSLFSRPPSDPARACWHALIASRDPRLKELARAAERRCDEVARRKKYSPLTPDIVRRKAREMADEPYSQIPFEFALERLSNEALDACPERDDFRTLAAEAKAAADALRDRLERERKERERKEAEEERLISAHLDAAKAAVKAVYGKDAYDGYKLRRLALEIARGADGVALVREWRDPEEARQAAIDAAWKKIEELARRVSIPTDTSDLWGKNGIADFGEHPARWVRKTRSLYDGYLPDGDGGFYYAGFSRHTQPSSVVEDKIELRPDWAERWEAAKAAVTKYDSSKLDEFVSAFSDALGITAAEQEAIEERKRLAADAALQEAQRTAIKAVYAAAKVSSGAGRSPAKRRASATILADIEEAKKALDAVLAIECPTPLSREVQAEQAKKLRDDIGAMEAAAEESKRWEAVIAAGDNASDEDIKAMIDSGWLWWSEIQDWSARLDRRAEERNEKERREKAKRFTSGAWDALDKLKL